MGILAKQRTSNTHDMLGRPCNEASTSQAEVEAVTHAAVLASAVAAAIAPAVLAVAEATAVVVSRPAKHRRTRLDKSEPAERCPLLL